jgi:hypothetical protein
VVLTCLEAALPPVIRSSAGLLLVRGRQNYRGWATAWTEISAVRIVARVPDPGVRDAPGTLIIHRHGSSKLVAIQVDCFSAQPREIADSLRRTAADGVPVTFTPAPGEQG